MKPGIKATVILMATLVLGIAIGFVGHGTYHRFSHDHSTKEPRPSGFVDRMERVIRPDSTYADTVHALLLKHEARFLEINKQQRETMRVMMDSLITDLRGLVPEDRIERLEQIRDRGPGRGRKGRRR